MSSSTAVAYSKLSVSVQLAFWSSLPATGLAYGRHTSLLSPGFGETAQFLKDRGVQDLLKPRESATSKGSIENPVIEG